MKIGVIGGGNMGGAIAASAAAHGVTDARQIIVSHPKQGFALPAEIRTTRDNTLAVTDADIVVLAVKPWLAAEVVREIAPALTPTQSLVSVVAGLSFADLGELLPAPRPALFQAMPNTALSVGRSVTFITSERASEVQRTTVLRLFDALGATFEIPEKQMQAGMAVASCGIAYALRYIDAAARGGQLLGMEYAEAQQVVMQTLEGAIALLRTNGTAPQTEIDKVTTPGGITLRGLEAMERNGFSDAVIAGLMSSK